VALAEIACDLDLIACSRDCNEAADLLNFLVIEISRAMSAVLQDTIALADHQLVLHERNFLRNNSVFDPTGTKKPQTIRSLWHFSPLAKECWEIRLIDIYSIMPIPFSTLSVPWQAM
jgi:hypothetical protein